MRSWVFLALVAAVGANEPTAPMFDPMAVGLVFAGNHPNSTGGPETDNESILKAGTPPDIQGERLL